MCYCDTHLRRYLVQKCFYLSLHLTLIKKYCQVCIVDHFHISSKPFMLFPKRLIPTRSCVLLCRFCIELKIIFNTCLNLQCYLWGIIKYAAYNLMPLWVSYSSGRVTIGEYDGEHPCLTAATIGDKVNGKKWILKACFGAIVVKAAVWEKSTSTCVTKITS